MTSQTSVAADSHHLPGASGPAAARPPRIWPAVVLLGSFWVVYSVWRWTDLGTFYGFFGFLILLAFALLTTLLFAGWWLGASRVRWSEKLLVVGAGLGFGVITAIFSDKRLGPFLVLPGVPLVMTA